MIVTTRTASRNARLLRPSPDRLAAIDDMVARAGALGSFPRMTAPTAEETPPPAPAAPNVAPDTSARLDAHDAELRDHGSRIAALEERSPPPEVNDGAANVPAEARAAVGQPQMVDAGALYARMRALRTGPKADSSTPPKPVTNQATAGEVLDGRAITARHNAAARAGRAV